MRSKLLPEIIASYADQFSTFFFFYLFIFLFFQLDWVEKLSYLTVLATELRDEITCEQPTKAVIILHEQGFTQL